MRPRTNAEHEQFSVEPSHGTGDFTGGLARRDVCEHDVPLRRRDLALETPKSPAGGFIQTPSAGVSAIGVFARRHVEQVDARAVARGQHACRIDDRGRTRREVDRADDSPEPERSGWITERHQQRRPVREAEHGLHDRRATVGAPAGRPEDDQVDAAIGRLGRNDASGVPVLDTNAHIHSRRLGEGAEMPEPRDTFRGARFERPSGRNDVQHDERGVMPAAEPQRIREDSFGGIVDVHGTENATHIGHLCFQCNSTSDAEARGPRPF